MIRQTHTHANLEVSRSAYDEIAGKLRAADYGHAFGDDGTIDMHGIALVATPHPIGQAEPALNLGRKPDGSSRHPSTMAVLRHFRYDHLPAQLQSVSKAFAIVAAQMADTLPEGPDLTCGLRDLLSAKDNCVRARIP